MHALAASFSVVCLVISAPRSQVPIWTRQGTPPPMTMAFAGPLAVIGDINGDGHDDVATSIGTNFQFQGFHWILSGRDGATLRIQPPFLSIWDYALQAIARTGDMNGDGIGDYALGWASATLQTDIVQVRSAADDSLLWQHSGSWSSLYAFHVAGDLDTNGDGLRDLVVSAERENGFGGAIRVYGNNGALRYTISLLPGITYLGRSLAKVGDVNGDGCDDFAAGAIDTVGVVIVFSGLTGVELRRGYGDNDGVLGWSVTGCGDMNGDGVPDFAGGTSGGFGQRGMVRVFSGATGNPLYTWWSPSSLQYGNGFGKEIRGGADVNRDGVPDILIANGDYNSTVAETMLAAYSGRDGSRIFLSSMTDAGTLEALIRVPGDPFPSYLTWLYTWAFTPTGPFEVGSVRMNRASPPGVDSFGTACSGTLATTPKIGIHKTQQNTTRVHLSGGAPGGFGILLLGLSDASFLGWPLPFPLSGYGYTGCMLSTSIDAFVVVNLATTGNAAGYGFFDLPLPLAGTGWAVHGQWLALDAGAAAGGVSDALRWRF